jgi:hypothetical protein
MHALLDDVLVAAVLFASAAYALVSLGPRALKSWLLRRGSALLNLLPRTVAGRLADRLEAAAGAKVGGCGGCGSCGEEPAPAGKAEDTEVRVPLSQIGKR